ncbi:MAG: efflux transporter periplasmic adaptor subunit [Verrucomicrobiaceae bacterium]|nr:efflux transporter periplasmic adaptor subunit [Verrucomicrobiaceae bacterium]MDB6120857.1 efflux transporter periplasmic adaptor subunit [Verrucomicrobiaceae bacterium]
MNSNSERLALGSTLRDESPVVAPARKPRLGLLFFLVLILVAAGVYAGMKPRLAQRSEVAQESRELAIRSVGVVKPAPATTSTPMVFSGELKPVAEAVIYARASGYVSKWDVDMGAQVKAGDLLAELDTPELDSSLSQARAVLVQAQAAQSLAVMTSNRWQKLLADRAVSTQEVDEKKGDADLKKAAVDAAKADVQRLEELRSFARITAPFDGTITARSLDVGKLVTAGGSSELYRIAQTNKLRVFVRIPQAYARAVEVNQTAELTMPELQGRSFNGKVVRTAASIDPASRTLLTEIEVDNAKGQLLSGSYAQVHLNAAMDEASLTVSSNTVLFRAQGPQLAIVHDDGKVELRLVKLGRDFGTDIEIINGLKLGERVIVNPPDSIFDGAEVNAVEVETTDKGKK